MTRTDYLAAVRAWAAENLPRGATLQDYLPWSDLVEVKWLNSGIGNRVTLILWDHDSGPYIEIDHPMMSRRLGDVRELVTVLNDAVEFGVRLEAKAAELRPVKFKAETETEED